MQTIAQVGPEAWMERGEVSLADPNGPWSTLDTVCEEMEAPVTHTPLPIDSVLALEYGGRATLRGAQPPTYTSFAEADDYFGLTSGATLTSSSSTEEEEDGDRLDELVLDEVDLSRVDDEYFYEEDTEGEEDGSGWGSKSPEEEEMDMIYYNLHLLSLRESYYHHQNGAMAAELNNATQTMLALERICLEQQRVCDELKGGQIREGWRRVQELEAQLSSQDLK